MNPYRLYFAPRNKEAFDVTSALIGAGAASTAVPVAAWALRHRIGNALEGAATRIGARVARGEMDHLARRVAAGDEEAKALVAHHAASGNKAVADHLSEGVHQGNEAHKSLVTHYSQAGNVALVDHLGRRIESGDAGTKKLLDAYATAGSQGMVDHMAQKYHAGSQPHRELLHGYSTSNSRGTMDYVTDGVKRKDKGVLDTITAYAGGGLRDNLNAIKEHIWGK